MSKLEQQLAEMRDYALRLECFCPKCKPCVKMLRAAADAIAWQRDWFRCWTEESCNKHIYDDQLAARLGGKGG